MRRLLNLLLMVNIVMSINAYASKVFFDFSTDEGSVSDGATAPKGWDYSSIGKSEGVAYFNSKSDVMASPVFDHTITNISIECKCSNAEANRLLRIIPLTVTSGKVTTNDSMIVTFEAITSKTSQFATFDQNLCINAFLIGVQQSGTGMWKVFSATVMHTGPDTLERPTGLRNDSVSSNSFTAVWNPAPGAQSYAIRLWNINDAEPTWEESYFDELFGKLQNSGGNPKDIKDKLPDNINPGWEGDFIYIPTNSQEIVQIGNTSNRGWLMSPQWADADHTENLTLLVRACRPKSKNKGGAMPVDIVRTNPDKSEETITNSLGSVSLSDEFAYYDLPLNNFQIGDRLLFHSMTNGSEKRVIFDKIQVVSKFSHGNVTTNELYFTDGITNTEHTIETLKNEDNLEPGTYHWAVRADATGEDGLWSDSISVKITESSEDDNEDSTGGGTGDNPGGGDEGNPGDDDDPEDGDIPHVDFSETAWRTYEMEAGIGQGDFSMVTDIKKGTSWENGVSIPGIFYFKNDDYLKTDEEAKRTIKLDSRKATSGGLYASYTNNISGIVDYFSLSLLGSGNDTHSIELPILNDSPSKMKIFSANVQFTVYQTTFKGKESEERKLISEWGMSKNAMSRPKANEWHEITNATFTALQTLPASESSQKIWTHYEENKHFKLNDISVPYGGMLWLRWRTEKKANYPMIGINNLTVTVEIKKEPTSIRIR